MAPIPIYSQSPISAAKPSGVTPATEGAARAAPETPTKTRPLAAGAVPPPPQPGAVPSLTQPPPTGAGQNPYAPPAPAITGAPVANINARTSGYSPAPPQPGAAPVPPTTASPYYQRPPQPPTTTAAAVLPPPPRHGETLASTGIVGPPAAPPTTSMPPQMSMPPLTGSPYPGSARGTTTSTASTASSGIPQPTGLAQGLAMGEQQQSSLDHPPGYVQNAYAAEMTSTQREAARMAGTGRSSYRSERNSDYGGGNTSGGASFDGDEGIWGAAKKLASNAGERLSAAETEVWKYINKQ